MQHLLNGRQCRNLAVHAASSCYAAMLATTRMARVTRMYGRQHGESEVPAGTLLGAPASKVGIVTQVFVYIYLLINT